MSKVVLPKAGDARCGELAVYHAFRILEMGSLVCLVLCSRGKLGGTCKMLDRRGIFNSNIAIAGAMNRRAGMIRRPADPVRGTWRNTTTLPRSPGQVRSRTEIPRVPSGTVGLRALPPRWGFRPLENPVIEARFVVLAFGR